jgi:hypothetical protein
MIPPGLILVMIFLACQPVAVDPPLTFEQRWVPIPKERELTFEERWEPVKRLPPMLLNNDIGPRIIPVKTVPIRAEPAVYIEETKVAEVTPMPPPRPAPQVAPRVVPRILYRPKDVCARHGMHKEVTRGGKSWRCRRGGKS